MVNIATMIDIGRNLSVILNFSDYKYKIVLYFVNTLFSKKNSNFIISNSELYIIYNYFQVQRPADRTTQKRKISLSFFVSKNFAGKKGKKVTPIDAATSYQPPLNP